MKPIVVVAAYKREKSLQRLFDSLIGAQYPNDVNVIVSLDGGYSEGVYNAALDFKDGFLPGQVEIVARKENLGLRNHILWCGDQSIITGSVIVLEDDIVVDKQFYLYASSAASFYKTDLSVAGIAIYSQEYNEYSGLPFFPVRNNSSCYFMQMACSWGQLWTDVQWQSFKKWYADINSAYLYNMTRLPDSVKRWPETSWKKYYNGYLVEKNLFFVYPYRSYTSNVSDPGGSHTSSGTSLFQTKLALPFRSLDTFDFLKLESAGSVKYDSFMEPCSNFIFDALNLTIDELEVDLYGTKPLGLLKNKKYALTSRRVDKYERYFPFSFKPFENALIYDGVGENGFYLTLSSQINEKNKADILSLAEYLSCFPIASKKNTQLAIKANFLKLYLSLVKFWLRVVRQRTP